MPLHTEERTEARVDLNKVAIASLVACETIPPAASLSGQTKSNRNKRPYR